MRTWKHDYGYLCLHKNILEKGTFGTEVYELNQNLARSLHGLKRTERRLDPNSSTVFRNGLIKNVQLWVKKELLSKKASIGFVQIRYEQAGKQADQMNRQMGNDCTASENGKLPRPRNQLDTFDQSGPRHQLLWDNRQPSEPWQAAATVGAMGQYPPGKGRVDMAHRAKSRQWARLKCCVKASNPTSRTAAPLSPSLSTQHSRVLTSQTSLSAGRSPRLGMVQGFPGVWTCLLCVSWIPVCAHTHTIPAATRVWHRLKTNAYVLDNTPVAAAF